MAGFGAAYGLTPSQACASARGLYEALGFAVERVAHDYDGPGEDRVLFVKQLS